MISNWHYTLLCLKSMSSETAYEACPCQHCRGQLWSKGEMSATYSNAFYEGLRPSSTPGDYGMYLFQSYKHLKKDAQHSHLSRQIKMGWFLAY